MANYGSFLTAGLIPIVCDSKKEHFDLAEGKYRKASESDKSGKSTKFIEYMLNVIDISISALLDFNNRTLSEKDRLEYYVSLNKTEFTRKDYMDVFKDISSATASRDLKKGAELGFFEKIGEKNKTIYRFK